VHVLCIHPGDDGREGSYIKVVQSVPTKATSLSPLASKSLNDLDSEYEKPQEWVPSVKVDKNSDNPYLILIRDTTTSGNGTTCGNGNTKGSGSSGNGIGSRSSTMGSHDAPAVPSHKKGWVLCFLLLALFYIFCVLYWVYT